MKTCRAGLHQYVPGQGCPQCRSIRHKIYTDSHKDQSKARLKSDPERTYLRKRNEQLLCNFSITLDQYNQMLSDQNYCCAICKRHESEFKKALAVDHDHDTNKIRNLLCHDCNVALGMFKDDFNILLTATKYIQEHKGII